MGDLLHLRPPNGETTSASITTLKTNCVSCGEKTTSEDPRADGWRYGTDGWHFGTWLDKESVWLCPECWANL